LLQLKLAPATTVAVNPCQHHLKLAHPVKAEVCLPSGYMCSWRSEITAPNKASVPNCFEVLLSNWQHLKLALRISCTTPVPLCGSELGAEAFHIHFIFIHYLLLQLLKSYI
jgi:hypothetical protein